MNARIGASGVASAVCVSALLVCPSLCKTPGAPLDAGRADIWLFPPGNDPLAACHVDGEVWVALAQLRADPASGAVAVFDGAGQLTGWIPMSAAALCLAHDAERSCVCATTIPPAFEFIDVPSRQVVGTVDLDHIGLGMTIAGDRAYVNAWPEPLLYAIDLRQRKLLGSIKLSQTSRESVLVGEKLYVATGEDQEAANNYEGTPALVDVVDLATRRVSRSVPLPGQGVLAIAWDGNRYVYASTGGLDGLVVRIDTATEQMDESFLLRQRRVSDIVLDPVRSLALLARSVPSKPIAFLSLPEFRFVRRIAGGQGGIAVQRDPQGAIQRLWVPNHQEDCIFALDVDASLAGTGRIAPAAPSAPIDVLGAHAWLLQPDSRPVAACLCDSEVWLALERRNAVAVFSTQGEIKGWVPFAESPERLAYDRERSCVYVTSRFKARVTVVDARTYRRVEVIDLEHPAYGVTIASDRAYANAVDEPLVYVIDLAARKAVSSLKLSQPGLESVLVGHKLYVLTGVRRGLNGKRRPFKPAVEILDTQTGSWLGKVHLPGTEAAAIASDGRRYVYAASVYRGGELLRIDTETDALDGSFPASSERVKDLVIDPVRRVAVLACWGTPNELRVVSLDTREQLRCISGGEGLVAAERNDDASLERLWIPNPNADFVLSIDAASLIPGM
jgi:DNA-binding beta-propeller fold protein YncE